MSAFEVVDFIPSYEKKCKHAELFAELVEKLEKLKNGAAIRKEMEDMRAAMSLKSTAYGYFKRNKLTKEYFTTVRKDEDKVYAYFGKRKNGN